MLNGETLYTTYSQLFGPSYKFGKCFTLSSFFVCVKKIVFICPSNVISTSQNPGASQSSFERRFSR